MDSLSSSNQSSLLGMTQLPSMISRRQLLRMSAMGAFAVMGADILAACGTSANAGTPASFTWEAIPPYSLQSTDPKRVSYLQGAITTWQNQHKPTKISTVVASSDETAANARLLSQFAQKRGPDVAQIDGYIFPVFAKYAQPIDSYLSDNGLSVSDFFPFCQKIMKNSKGQTVGLQFTTDVRLMYYRKDLIPTPPASWDDVFTIGQQVKKNGYGAYLFPAGRGEATTITSLLPYYWAQGYELYDSSNNLLIKNDPEKSAMLTALEFIQKLVQQGLTPARVTQYTQETALNSEIASGKVAMVLGGNFQVPQLVQVLGSDKFYSQWGVAPIPSKDGTSHATTSGGWVWAVFTQDKTKQRDAVSFVADTFVNNQGMVGWCNVGGYLPTRSNVYSLSTLQTNQFTTTFRNYLQQYAHVRPAASSYQTLSTALQVAVGSIVSGSQSASDALNTVLQQVS